MFKKWLRTALKKQRIDNKSSDAISNNNSTGVINKLPYTSSTPAPAPYYTYSTIVSGSGSGASGGSGGSGYAIAGAGLHGWPSTTNISYNIAGGGTVNLSSVGSPPAIGQNAIFTQNKPTSKIHSLIEINSDHKEIVRLRVDGRVIWNDGIQIDEAAKALSKTFTLSTEIAAGISDRVKYDARDSVFAELINIAKEKGPLSADDLTYFLEASKIMEKLKGY